MFVIASFNHGDYYKGALPLLGLALSWFSAVILVLVALIFLCIRTQRRRVRPLCIVVWILTALCAFFHFKGAWHLDSNDILVTGLPAVAALLIYVIVSLLKRSQTTPPAA